VKEVIGNATLYLGDCLEILPTLGKVEAVVTDPPYGIGFKYETHNDTPKNYEDLLLPAIRECVNLTDGPQMWWQSMKNCHRWHEWFPEGWRIFAAAKGFYQIRGIEMQYAWDPVICFGWGATKSKESIRDWHVSNIPNFGGGRESIAHPCPRPLPQVEYVVSGLHFYSTILDPFMGSGTTAIASCDLGHKFIGIEIDPTYFDVACARIERAQKQRRLFA